MGLVVYLRHGRASQPAISTGRRACASANASNVTSLIPRSPADRTSADHHSDGMRSRWGHFLTANRDAPVSSEIASSEGHRASKARGVRSSDMAISLGPNVLNVKAKLSHDSDGPVGENADMADRMSETEEKAAFIRRTKQAREAQFEGQGPICIILDIPQDQYKHYEKRTPLPYRFIKKFCAACKIDVEWLLSGDQSKQGPVEKTYPSLVPKKKRGRKPKQQQAA